MPHVPRVQMIRRPGRRPYFSLRVAGKLHHLGVDHAEAHRKAAVLLAGAVRQTEPLTVAGLVRAWLIEHPGAHNNEFSSYYVTFAGAMLLSSLEPDCLRVYARDIQQRGLSASTQRTYVRYAKLVLTWAREREWIDFEPYPVKLPTPKRSPKDLPLQTLHEILVLTPERARRILRFMLFTGCRPSEACALEWSMFDERNRAFRLVAHKTANTTGKDRIIHLSPAAMAVLDELPHPRVGVVFQNRQRRAYKPNGLRTILQRAGKAHPRKIHVSGPYVLRHSFAQAVLDSGVSIEDVAGLLGHVGLRSITVYAQVRDERLGRVAATLGMLDTPPSPDQSPPASASASPPAPDPGTPESNPRRSGSAKTA